MAPAPSSRQSEEGRQPEMKVKTRTMDRTERNLMAAAFLFLLLLFLSACGEVASVEEMGPGGGVSPNSLMLSWTAPSTNEDGSPLQDLAGYKVYYGTHPGQYSNVVTVGNYTTAELGDMGPGTWYVAVTAYDAYGNESAYSNEINHTFN